MPGNLDINQFRFSSHITDENKILMEYKSKCERYKRELIDPYRNENGRGLVVCVQHSGTGENIKK